MARVTTDAGQGNQSLDLVGSGPSLVGTPGLNTGGIEGGLLSIAGDIASTRAAENRLILSKDLEARNKAIEDARKQELAREASNNLKDGLSTVLSSWASGIDRATASAANQGQSITAEEMQTAGFASGIAGLANSNITLDTTTLNALTGTLEKLGSDFKTEYKTNEYGILAVNQLTGQTYLQSFSNTPGGRAAISEKLLQELALEGEIAAGSINDVAMALNSGDPNAINNAFFSALHNKALREQDKRNIEMATAYAKLNEAKADATKSRLQAQGEADKQRVGLTTKAVSNLAFNVGMSNLSQLLAKTQNLPQDQVDGVVRAELSKLLYSDPSTKEAMGIVDTEQLNKDLDVLATNITAMLIPNNNDAKSTYSAAQLKRLRTGVEDNLAMGEASMIAGLPNEAFMYMTLSKQLGAGAVVLQGPAMQALSDPVTREAMANNSRRQQESFQMFMSETKNSISALNASRSILGLDLGITSTPSPLSEGTTRTVGGVAQARADITQYANAFTGLPDREKSVIDKLAKTSLDTIAAYKKDPASAPFPAVVSAYNNILNNPWVASRLGSVGYSNVASSWNGLLATMSTEDKKDALIAAVTTAAEQGTGKPSQIIPPNLVPKTKGDSIFNEDGTINLEPYTEMLNFIYNPDKPEYPSGPLAANRIGARSYVEGTVVPKIIENIIRNKELSDLVKESNISRTQSEQE